MLLRILLFSLVTLASAQSPTLYVLCYHTFSTNFSSAINFPPEVFKNHLKTLQEAGYRFVSWKDLLSHQIQGGKNILLTIDDGNISVRHIEPLLDAMGISPILFIYPAIIGRVKYALTWEDLDRLTKKGWTIGAHGYNHLYVNQKLYTTDPQAFFREIRLSKQVLEKHLHQEITLFGYPFGVYSTVTIETLQKEKYAYGFTIAGKPTTWPPADPYQIPRYLMTPGMWHALSHRLTATNLLASRNPESNR